MPAPTKGEILLALRQSCLSSGKFMKHDADGNVIPGELPEGLEDILDSMAGGLASAWSQWQSRQICIVQGVTPGASAAAGAPGTSLP